MEILKITSFFIVFIISACSDIIEYSPFDMDVSSRSLNTGMVQKIIEAPGTGDTLKFVVFSDTHENYDILAEALDHIHRRNDISFIICNGDVTNNGLAREYEWYIEVISRSVLPLVTVIGNHDCLANGREIYHRLFGPENFSFTAGNYRFVIFNNIVWENHNVSPEYLWLEKELADSTRNNLLFAHMTPMALDIDDLNEFIFRQIVDSTNTIMGAYASSHRFYQYNDRGIPSFTPASIDKREYCLVSVNGGKVIIDRIFF